MSDDPTTTENKSATRKRAAKATGPASGWEAGMVTAARALKGIEKRGRNTFHGYEYATAEDVMDACRAALISGGMMLDASEWDLEERAAGTFLLRQVVRVVHESGEVRERRIVWPVVPEKGRPIDKAVAVALTASLAYCIRGMLVAPRGIGEPDMSDRDDRSFQPPKPQQARPQPQASPPRPKPAAPARKPPAKPQAPTGLQRLIFAGCDRHESSGVEWCEISASVPGTGESVTLYVRDPQMLDAAERVKPGELYEVDVEEVRGRGNKAVSVAVQWRALPHEPVEEPEPVGVVEGDWDDAGDDYDS